MTDEKDLEDVKRYVNILNPKVKNNITIVKAEEQPFPYMLHIDVKPPSKFIPMMPRRAANSEDNTVPRVTVADTLLGCIIAYCNMGMDFDDIKIQGQYICALPYDYCLKPTNKLVYDAERSNEHWLVGYNKKTLSYKPEIIGKMFLTEITTKRESIKGKLRFIYYWTFYLEIEKPILFGKNITLEPGYYRIKDEKVSRHFDNQNDFSYADDGFFDITRLSKSEYMKQKEVSAVLLDNNSLAVPLYSKW